MKLFKISVGTLFIASQSLAAIDGNIDNSNETVDNDPIYQYFEAELDDQTNDDNQDNRVAQATDAEKPAGDTAVTAEGSTPVEGEAPKKKVVKKTKKKKVEGDVAAGDLLTTSGHGVQESGLPYKANVDLSFEYSSTSQTQKYKDNSYKKSNSNMGLDISYLFVFGKFEVGPKLLYASTKLTEESADSASGEKSTSTTTTSSIGFGAGLVFNLGNIHQSKMVPYVGADFGRLSSVETVKPESGGESKISDAEVAIGLEGGLKYFMGGHIALKPYFNYTMIMSGEHKIESSGSEALVASVTGSKLSLGVGLAKYF